MKLTNEQMQQSEALFLDMAIDTIRLNAIKNKVKTIGAVYGHIDIKTTQISSAVIRITNPYRVSLRIAAAVTILLSSATIYKYASVNTQTLYDQQFTGYVLPTTRGVSVVDSQVEAYTNKHWNDVIDLNKGTIPQSNKSAFLTAMAKMELKQFREAEQLFQVVLANKTDKSFHDEADYFLALSFLVDHQEQKSLNKIAQIKANQDHTYYPLIHQIQALDLKIIELKKK